MHAANAPAPATVLPARSELDLALRRFESAAEHLGVHRPPAIELDRLCREIATFTRELFPGAIGVDVRVDPEIPDDLYFVFEVAAVGNFEDIVQRDEEWHRRSVAVARHWPGLFRLSIDAR